MANTLHAGAKDPGTRIGYDKSGVTNFVMKDDQRKEINRLRLEERNAKIVQQKITSGIKKALRNGDGNAANSLAALAENLSVDPLGGGGGIGQEAAARDKRLAKQANELFTNNENELAKAGGAMERGDSVDVAANNKAAVEDNHKVTPELAPYDTARGIVDDPNSAEAKRREKAKSFLSNLEGNAQAAAVNKAAIDASQSEMDRANLEKEKTYNSKVFADNYQAKMDKKFDLADELEKAFKDNPIDGREQVFNIRNDWERLTPDDNRFWDEVSDRDIENLRHQLAPTTPIGDSYSLDPAASFK
jgi:hypothetical protein